MKVVSIILLLACVALSTCVLIPAPRLNLMPLTVSAPELSPWLVLFHFMAAAIIFRFHRRLIPAVLASLLVSAWPLMEIPSVERSVAAQLSPSNSKGQRRTLFNLRDCLRGMKTPQIASESLPLHILLYRGTGDGYRPALVDIYGGAWQRGSPRSNRPFHEYMASRGYTVFAVDYRHAPAVHFPAQLEDIRAAMAFVRANARSYGADPDRLILCGRSSGGQLALLAAYEQGATPVRAVISFYAPTNLERGYAELPWPDPIHVHEVLEAYLGGTPSQVAGQYRAASAVTYVRKSLPPTLLLQGARDHVVKPEFARELYQKLVASGNRAVLVELPWAKHAFDSVFSGIGNQLALHSIEEFLNQEVGKVPSSIVGR
jgi:acetyl esterase/lipase